MGRVEEEEAGWAVRREAWGCLLGRRALHGGRRLDLVGKREGELVGWGEKGKREKEFFPFYEL